MPVQKIHVLVPPLRGVPPGAAWAAQAVAWVFGTDPRRPSGLRLWAAGGESALARRPCRPREAGERQALIAMARHYESSQPEFAKDLYAAAHADRQG
jgi:hypothetical protein